MASALAAALPWLLLVSPMWYFAGRLAQRLKLPLVTGYLVAGILAGPQVAGLLDSKDLEALWVLDHLCLSFIALAAGAELQLAELRKTKHQVLMLTLSVAGFTWSFVYVLVLAMAPLLPVTAGQPAHLVGAVASLAATLAVARSPAAAIAVLRETDGRGPFCSLIMAVVVVKDVLVFVCFAINIELIRMASRKSLHGDGLRPWHLAEPLLSTLASAAIGYLAGGCLAWVLQQAGAGTAAAAPHSAAGHTGGRLALLARPLRPLGSALRPAGRALLPLAASGAAFFAAENIGAEPLLAAVAGGVVAANWRPDGLPAAREGGAPPPAAEALSAGIHAAMPPINVVFFGLAGASLQLSAVGRTLWAAAAIYIVRLAGIGAGSAAGSAAAGLPAAVRRRFWMGMVTQAGVALGLSRSVVLRFPEWGPGFAALEAGVIMMNMLSGPPLFKAAVISMGEAHAVAQSQMAGELHGDSKPHRSSSGQIERQVINVADIRMIGAGLAPRAPPLASDLPA